MSTAREISGMIASAKDGVRGCVPPCSALTLLAVMC